MKNGSRFGAEFAVAGVLWFCLGVLLPAAAQDITEFSNGYLTFTNENPALYYRIEFKPNLTDPLEWDGSFQNLRNIQAPEGEVTVPVPVFLRVVGRETPWVSGSALAADILAGKTAYVNDQEVTGTMPNVGKQDVIPGTEPQPIDAGYHDGTGEVAGDPDLLPENIRKDVEIFGVSGTLEGSAGVVPATGQTSVWRTGDNGTHQTGVAWPNPRFTDHDDGTVTDNLTGLMWTKNANLDGSKSWNNAIDYCNNLELAGHSDWRLPNVRELQSLIDYGRSGPALPSGHPFSNVQWSGVVYWSSSTLMMGGQTSYAWSVSMNAGGVGSGALKDSSQFVWPVRGGE